MRLRDKRFFDGIFLNHIFEEAEFRCCFVLLFFFLFTKSLKWNYNWLSIQNSCKILKFTSKMLVRFHFAIWDWFQSENNLPPLTASLHLQITSFCGQSSCIHGFRPSIVDLVTEAADCLTAPQGTYSFSMKSGAGRLGNFILYKKAYKLGEDVIGRFDFDNAEVRCIQVTILKNWAFWLQIPCKVSWCF